LQPGGDGLTPPVIVIRMLREKPSDLERQISDALRQIREKQLSPLEYRK
jgi:hypothetical protein